MLTIPRHPRARQVLLAAAVLPFLTACQPGAAAAADTTAGASQDCSHLQNPRQQRRCEEARGAQAQPASRSRPTGTKWSADQLGNARLIITVGRERGVPRRGHVVALATAMQESSLRNLGHLGARNDHDSLGLFQQRPSQGWGTPAQVRDPRYAAGKFYDRLLQVSGWQQMPIWAAAQAVQVSAFPMSYDKWVGDAERLAG